jgi:hypothetical protein
VPPPPPPPVALHIAAAAEQWQLPMPPNRLHSFRQRHLSIKNLRQQAFIGC